MVKSITLALMMLSAALLQGQNLLMTFSAAGASGTVDSVKATNLRSNQNVTLPGKDTLILNMSTGIIDLQDQEREGFVFPNPCQGSATFITNISETQTVTLKVHTLSGQTVAQTQALLQPGIHHFSLALSRTGVYLISLITNQGIKGFKVICTESGNNGNKIRYAGTIAGNVIPPLKSATVYTLGYSAGDIILYRCRGGIHTTIITDSPTNSKNYEVVFAPCTDPAGKSYAIVKIGSQTWMAENLAWLPAVSSSVKGSDSLKYYYVYGYEDSLVTAAKNTLNYKLYGVLYNWPAAMNSSNGKSSMSLKTQAVCPAGWHLPEDGEWKTLELALGMSQQDADTIFLRNSGEVGKQIKCSMNWADDGTGTNASGFTALPGGYRNLHGSFLGLNENALFWSASLRDSTAWYRGLSSLDSGVYRTATLGGQGFSIRCIKDTP